ncbi:ADP-ribose pyrophosphatase YjhB (NUDIX family) [Enterococcus sp. PF1-24]|uniref:NUDIX hydrolase n=1 Tax=unclassified Enterococcus TaxID=2608891 RepID=UPI002473A24F|nr:MULTISPECIES: NUDIX hydrolase [unclassified Enterococcus]MDH6364187.1 ADP-ribose pyrophosphatase YjhB (NUDIX family) [Enterococcus sp. PFB1-1]MDH6401288.1 ADP-ribose pyrophosphatase YjhB (NUDIX family) [Enterococcus sp. PF1-24]
MNRQLFDTYRRLLTIAEAGIFYGKDQFDQERYRELKEISLQLLSKVSENSFTDLQKITEKDEGYPTPKVDVRAFIQKEDKILLVQDAISEEWSLPGGYAEVGITPMENVRKEVFEETGLEVAVQELLAIFDTNLRGDIPQLFQYYKLVFRCEVLSGEFQENLETLQMDYFSLAELPALSKKRTTKEQLQQLVTTKELICQ